MAGRVLYVRPTWAQACLGRGSFASHGPSDLLARRVVSFLRSFTCWKAWAQCARYYFSNLGRTSFERFRAHSEFMSSFKFEVWARPNSEIRFFPQDLIYTDDSNLFLLPGWFQ